MSTEDKIRQWEESLPEIHRRPFDNLVDLIRDEMDKVVQGEQKIDILIGQFIQLCDELGLPREETSAYIKYKLRGIVSEDTIEKHLPKDRKRAHKDYERYQEPEIRSSGLPKKVLLEQSSSGSESYTKPEDGTEGEREVEPEVLPDVEIPDSALYAALKESEIRLNEALTLADDKDKRIYELEMKQGELEMEMEDLKKKPMRKESDIEKIEALQIENDELKSRILEIQEIERSRIKESGFSTASKIPKHPWIAAIDALPFYITLRRARDYAINNNDPWRKILFDAGEDGKLSNARLEGENA